MANPDSSKRNFFSGDGSKELNSIPYSEAVSRMENSVAELCAQLDHSAEDGMNIDAWITLLEKYIAENSNRLYYSTISNYVFQMDELRFSDFCLTLEKLWTMQIILTMVAKMQKRKIFTARLSNFTITQIWLINSR